MHPILTKIIHKLWYVFCAIIILAALLVSITSLLTPVLNEHRADFEKMASNILMTPVMIGSVKVTWHGYSPEIDLDSVSILDLQTQKPKAVIQRLRIDFSIWQTMWTRQIAIRNLSVYGVQLTITQNKAGNIQIGNLASLNVKDNLTGASVETDKIAAWIFLQPRLALMNIDIHVVSPNQPERFVTLRALSLKNNGKHHIIDGKVTLNQELPTNVDVHFAWEGDIRQFQMTKGDFYLYLQSLSLPQWFSKMTWQGFKIRKGLASIKLWGAWQNNQWQKVQSNFQIYGLEAYSDQTKTTEKINRLSANVGWKTDGKKQTLAGDEIYIDFPKYNWPITDFEISTMPDATGALILKSAKVHYLNLTDVSRLALESTLLSDNLNHLVRELGAMGEIKDLNLTFAAGSTDINALSLAMQFSQLGFNAWHAFPGAHHLNGVFNWDKAKGNLKIKEGEASLQLPQLFTKSLSFEQLTANLSVAHDIAGNWTLTGRNIFAKNKDGSANIELDLTIPPLISPTIHLTANFAVANVAHISDYLPLKTLDSDLSEWLTNAFKSGHADNGKVTLTGSLNNFPFDHNNGQFFISTQIHDTTLNFAPDWPMINHIEGLLTFAGRSMTADVHSGQIFNVPINNIRGVIPYIGDDQPQILHVDGVLNGDLQQGLDFIQSSPLKKTVGKDLKGMLMKGPMQLTLGLVVPVKRPAQTTVTGSVVMSNSLLDLPDWQLTMKQINGSFQFTEKGIEAKNITATLFDSPTTLTLNTFDKTGQVKANLSSTVSVSQLEKWLQVTLPFAEGSSAYQAQLLLSGHDQTKPDQITITTNLAGVAINAPSIYGKKVDQKKNLQLTISVPNSQALNAKLDYAKLASAAVTLNKSHNEFQFVSGELRLGGGNANLQKTPGLLITGEMPEFNWDIWQNYLNSFQKPGDSSQKAQLDLLRGVDLSTRLINAAGQQLHNARINVTLNQTAWLIKIKSEELGGDVTLPFNLTNEAVVGHFQYCHVSTPGSKNATNTRTVNPSVLPMLSIDSDDVEVNGINFGHVALSTVPSNGGLFIKQLSIDEPSIKLNASGEWLGSTNRSKTHLQGEVSTPRISEVLNKWEFDSHNFVGSTGKITFNLNWADAPFRPTLAGLAGDLTLKLGDGRIVELSESSDAKMGLGRMLNLFSLSTIPRRLSLNFSDLFEKGYSFDSLNASFNLRSGSAFTENMRFDGPIARVDIKGRVGLKAQDFDLQIGVTPYVTGSLPIVATIAGGPVIGVATWVVDRVISSQVSRLTTYQYNVSGPWTKPVWSDITAAPSRTSAIFPFSLFPISQTSKS